MFTSQLIPNEFFDSDVETQHYSYYTCLNEFSLNLHKLIQLIQEKKTKQARFVLHQMKGTANVLMNSEIIETLKAIHLAVKLESLINPLQLTDEMKNILLNLYIDLNEEYKQINVLFFDEHHEAKGLIHTLKQFESIKEIRSINLKSDINKMVFRFMPDIFFIVQRAENSLELNEIESIKSKFPGSTLCFLDGAEVIDLQDNREELADLIGDLKKFRRFDISENH